MNYFRYRKGELFCEDVSLRTLCERHGTPLYVYSKRTIVQHVRHLRRSWRSYPVVVAYAMKANSNLAVLRIFRDLGAWVDTVSLGEMYRALQAGFPPERIIFGGVGKSEEELAYAVRKRVALVVADSVEEIELLGAAARRAKRRVRVAIRVNPGVDPMTHGYIATGTKESKFGVQDDEAPACFELAASLAGLEVVGIHQHIGSQIVEIKPFLESLRWLARLVSRIGRLGIRLQWIDIGGGIGITYKDEHPFALEDFTRQVLPVIRETGCRLIVEPGRVLVGNAGALLTRVLYVKTGDHKNFVIVDAAMNDLIRPAFYNAYHEIRPVRRRGGSLVADVVGPVCESGDFLAKDRVLESPRRGDLLAVMSAGAYGFAMSSNYNARARAAEVLVSGKRSALVRRRETLQDLVRGEPVRP
jgi:diaminopimelate decarboxylase